MQRKDDRQTEAVTFNVSVIQSTYFTEFHNIYCVSLHFDFQAFQLFVNINSLYISINSSSKFGPVNSQWCLVIVPCVCMQQLTVLCCSCRLLYCHLRCVTKNWKTSYTVQADQVALNQTVKLVWNWDQIHSYRVGQILLFLPMRFIV